MPFPNHQVIRFVDPSDTVGARRTVENILHILVEHCTNKIRIRRVVRLTVTMGVEHKSYTTVSSGFDSNPLKTSCD